MASAEFNAVLTAMKEQRAAAAAAGAAPVGFDEMRAGFDASAAPAPDDVKTTAVDAGGVPAEWVDAPGADAGRVIVYLHGGGYVVGSVVSHRNLASRLGRAAGARVLNVGYRMGPENPFPAAVDDAVAAYRWLMQNGGTPERTAVAGDSAGGGLALATLLALKDGGDTLPAAAFVMSPWTDLTMSGDSMTSRADKDPMIQGPMLGGMAQAYLQGKDASDPLISPLNGDLTGLPPVYAQVGEAEVLYDDAARFVEKAKAAGVDATFDPWPEMFHVWQLQASIIPEGQQALEKGGEFIKART